MWKEIFTYTIGNACALAPISERRQGAKVLGLKDARPGKVARVLGLPPPGHGARVGALLGQERPECVEVVPVPGQEGVDAVDARAQLVVHPCHLVPDVPCLVPHTERRRLHQTLDRLHVRELVAVRQVVPLDPDIVVAGGRGSRLDLGGLDRRGVARRGQLAGGLAMESIVTRLDPSHDFHGFVPRYPLNLV